jgi:hypothetical protein
MSDGFPAVVIDRREFILLARVIEIGQVFQIQRWSRSPGRVFS